MIIDCHTHVLPPLVKERRSSYCEKDAAFAAIYRTAKAAIASTEDLLESMARHEISRSVAVNYSWSTLEFCRETNDYILENSARHPDKITGFCSVPDFTSESSLREIERCALSGARGIGELRPDFHTSTFSDASAMAPFVQLLKKYKLMLLLHVSEPVGHIYDGKGSATPQLVTPFLERNPDIVVICAHWGGGLPFYFLMPEISKNLVNVYFDTAASPFLYRAEVYRIVSNLVGAKKILFGSDYPLMSPARLLRDIGVAGLSNEEVALILAGNARRLFEF